VHATSEKRAQECGEKADGLLGSMWLVRDVAWAAVAPRELSSLVCGYAHARRNPTPAQNSPRFAAFF
jgi:hypothetical protein